MLKFGKVYLLKGAAGLVYVGSTTGSLSRRLSMHMANYRAYTRGCGKWCSAFDVLEGAEGAQIELHSEHPYESRCELHRREGEVIACTLCVNRNMPGRMPGEYYRENRPHLLKYAKARYNTPAIREKYRKYYLANQKRLKEASLARYYDKKII